ncbi:DUF4011 domain-containing protein [Malacoplasma penetrans]|uniref:Predicted ATP/GTP-binding protein n=1 Tax=Malacoplasma penetrans (strain HF-2) TaxID=272633 RepID=Q8EUS4_MALP2|nr:AAA domain-containing protein [Malacoplasma penetrans]RXY96653.1 DUF4011 domain-containing protein [Malacoplasma penetrans]BAC44638.1 predicted ATP/GTP-binding protein [Malacoplasma penetrans HF-2]
MNSLKNKISNLINVSLREKAILCKVDSTHLPILNFASKKDINSFFENTLDSLALNLNINAKKISYELLESNDYQNFINVVNKYNINLSNTKLTLLEKNFKEHKLATIELCLSYLKNIKNKFLSLNRKAKEIKKDKGSWNLYLTKYFLKGLTPNDKSTINAPLLIYPVEITEKNEVIYINKINDAFELNEKLIVFLQRDSKKQEKNISDYKDINTLESLKKELETIVNNEIKIVKNNENDFPNEKKDTISQKYKELVIEPTVCLGIFDPSGGKLKEELSNLLASGEANELFTENPKISLDQIAIEEVSNKPIIQIDKLDIYQRYAVRSSLINDTIIYGPPGTGKSEVISNIIANILNEDKSILMVSEKVAALDVLKDRLKDLSIFMLSIHDLNDKEKFYDSINKINQFLGNSWLTNYHQNLSNSIFVEDINSKLSQLEKFKQLISKFDEFENYSYQNFDFKKFTLLVKEVGGFEYLNEIKKDHVIESVESSILKNNLPTNNYFAKLNLYKDFVIKNQIVEQDKYDYFVFEAKELDEYIVKHNIDIYDKYTINTCRQSLNNLTLFLNSNPNYKFILKSKPSKFFEDVIEFKKIKNALAGLVNNDLFTNIDQNKNKLKSFLNILSSSKYSHKKYILDEFVKNLNIVNKKPFSKLFYKTKLSENDNLILDNLMKLNNLHLDEYTDFEYIINNYFLFNTLHVLYYFNNNIFNESYIKFIKNGYDQLDLNTLKMIEYYKINIGRWESINQALVIYTDFVSKFPEFLSENLLTHFINKNMEIDWSGVTNLIMNIERNNILKKLYTLSSRDKEMVKRAFNVAGLKRRPSIYQYILDYVNVLKLVFPIWVSRPEQVATFVPFKKNFFNYGIFDEASQMFLERAYPLLHRCETNIVAGDDKQLRPSNFFVSRMDDEEDEYEIDDLDTQESLLDRAKLTAWVVVMLKNHYRSKSQELIKFSSEFIYDGKLNYATANGFNYFPAVELIEANGLFEDRVNKKEAEIVLQTLEKYKDDYKKVLVITFNVNQKTYIQSLLSDNKNISKEISSKFLNDEIEVVNIENVQGNEADLVILSIGYGRKNDIDKIRSQFGAIIQDGGKNRLNVAITRAKFKMIVVKSLKASDIADSNNENLMVFKKFLFFLEQLNKNKLVDKATEYSKLLFNSDFEKEVYEYIKNDIYKMNLKIATQYDVGNKKIHLVITKPDYNKVILGIELNHWKNIPTKIKKYEDVESQYFLEARGYKIFRILDHEWNYNKELVIKSLFNEIHQNLIKLGN